MSIDDRVIIRLNDEELKICQGYDVQIGVMTQPSRFAISLGSHAFIRDLLNKYRPGTRCEILVRADGRDLRQFVGRVDARRAVGPNAQLELRGRDGLAQLWGSYAVADKAYAENMPYEEFVATVAKDAGMDDTTVNVDIADDIIQKSGGVPDDIRRLGGKKRRVVTRRPHIKTGERYYDFVKRKLDRAGFVLMAGQDGRLTLYAPTDAGRPLLYQLVNKRSEGQRASRPPGTIITYDFDDDTAERYSMVVVYGRGQNPNGSVANASFSGEDLEMLNGYRLTRERGFVDAHVGNIDEAKFFARRQVFESRRHSHFLSYTVAGHSTVPVRGGKRIVWTRGTLVDVQDEELGIYGPHYIEHVAFFGNGDESHTVLRLLRTQWSLGDQYIENGKGKGDLLFLTEQADDEDEA